MIALLINRNNDNVGDVYIFYDEHLTVPLDYKHKRSWLYHKLILNGEFLCWCCITFDCDLTITAERGALIYMSDKSYILYMVVKRVMTECMI